MSSGSSAGVSMRSYRACFAAGLLLFAGSIGTGFVQVASTHGRLPGLSRDPFAAGREALARGDRARAVREYGKGAEVNRADYRTLLGAAEGLGRAGDVAGALETLDHAEALRPGQARTATVRGWALVLNGRPAEAFAAFAAALARDGDDALALAGLAEVLMGQRRYDEAARILARSVRLDPRRAFTRDSLGLALALGGRPREAVEHFAAALALEPTALRRANLERARGEADAVRPVTAPR